MATNKTYKRTRNLYDPADKKPFKLSRSKIDLFLECPRCFFLDRRLGVSRPAGPPFTLNSAVDALLKHEFDIYRANKKPHPIMEQYGVDAVPVDHELLNQWRQNFTGVQYLHEPTHLLIFGAIDDLWQNRQLEYLVIDYKSTSKAGQITKLNEGWHASYKRQMEIYQWLLRKNKLTVSDTGYFLYCNGQKDHEAFDGKLEFEMTLIPYTGKDDWIEQTVQDVYECLQNDYIPGASKECDYCSYLEAVDSASRNLFV